MRSCFLSSRKFISERIEVFAEVFSVLLLWTMLIHGEDVAILKLWRVMESRCDEFRQRVSLETAGLDYVSKIGLAR